MSAADVLTIVGKECEVCGSPRDAERMLLCDGCNKGFHLDCLSPPLAAIPESDWYCAACSAPAAAAAPSEADGRGKKRRVG